MGEQGGGRPTLWWNYGIEVEEALTKKNFHLTHKENIEKTKELLRKPGKLSLPFWIQRNCVPQNIPLRGHRDSAKMIQNWEKVNLLILEILYYYVMDPREEIETLRTMFSKPHECLMFYCFPLDFCCCFGGILRQTEIIN